MMQIDLDLRSALLQVRDQGDRPTCLAFAASDAHGYSRSLAEWLSPEYLYHSAGSAMPGWTPAQGIALHSARTALEKVGQPLEEHCPYGSITTFNQTQRLDPDQLYKCTSTVVHPHPDDLYRMALEHRVFILALQITTQFHYLNKPPFIIDKDQSSTVGTHAVFLSGLAGRNEQVLFLIKNSWGTAWGEGGYAWVTEDYLREYLVGALELLKGN